jgi:hypothetical protein
MGSKVFSYYLPSLAGGCIQNKYPVCHLPGSFPVVDVAKGPGGSGDSSAFWEISTNKSGPLNNIGEFASGFLTFKMEG